MKKKLLLCGLALLCIAATGCQKADTAQTAPISRTATAAAESAAPQQTASAAPATPAPIEAPAVTASVFTPGVWMARSGEYGQYYFFDADGIFGRTASYENGIGVPFTYEPGEGEGEVIFHKGASDESQNCKVSVTDETHLTLEWEPGDVEELTFVSALDQEHFHFYTNDELCELALHSYAAQQGVDESTLTAAAADNGDGTVTLQLYENLSDHNSTAAWYLIDRCTGKGTDANTGDAVDLTADAP